jgi:hypothetical protein
MIKCAGQAVAGCRASLLSVSTLAVPFTFHSSIETKTYAARCAHHLLQDADHLETLRGFFVGSRLASLMNHVTCEAALACGMVQSHGLVCIQQAKQIF